LTLLVGEKRVGKRSEAWKVDKKWVEGRRGDGATRGELGWVMGSEEGWRWTKTPW